jgi:NAD-dependent dihydropyrimidine dehydrogenase PreA subunit/flavodoxin
MIFYFSGTGNSLSVAQKIADAQGEKLIAIAEECKNKDGLFEYQLQKNELVGFVFPVYAWAPPKMILDFIDGLRLIGDKPLVFSVATCGDEEGDTTPILNRHLKKNGLSLDDGFTIRMPSNYVVGYDVESLDVITDKLKAADQKIAEINELLKRRERGIFHTIPGRNAAVKSKMINGLFNRFARKTDKFYVTDACTACGLCEKICPVGSITVKGKVTWGKECTQCLACINRCPVQAIQYGKGTLTRGRYVNPVLK